MYRSDPDCGTSVKRRILPLEYIYRGMAIIMAPYLYMSGFNLNPVAFDEVADIAGTTMRSVL